MLYLDSSAIVKLIVDEAESAALVSFVASAPGLSSCALARVEVTRAVRAQDVARVREARATLRAFDLIGLDDDLLRVAADLGDPVVRSLDAIHIAAAASLGDDLDALVTYDDRMTAAAEALALPLARPA